MATAEKTTEQVAVKDPSRAKPLSPLTRAELILLLTMATVQFTHIMDFMIMMPMGPQLMRLFSIEPREFGFLVAAYNFAAGITGLIGAFFLDRFDRKKALIVSYIGFTVGTVACAFAPTYILLLAARALAGLFGGVMGALIMSIVGDSIPPQKRGRAMGIVMTSFSLASVFGVPFGLALATHFSWHAPFLFIGGVASIMIAIIAMRMPGMTGHLQSLESRPSPYHVIHRVVTNPNQVRGLSLTVLLMLSQFMIIPFFSPSLVANAGFREDQLPFVYLVGGGLTIFTSPLIGRLSDRIGRPPVFVIFSLLLMLPAYFITHMGPTPIQIALLWTALFFVASNGRFVPAWAMITSTVRPEARGSFLSLNSSLQSMAGGAASFISSLIVFKAADGRLMQYDLIGYISIAIGVVVILVGRNLKPVDEGPVAAAH